MTSKRQHIQNARKLMRQMHSGVLSTQSLSIKGFPFGSVTPFFMTEEGDLVIYASDIAQHSRNMKTDPKVSLCVFDNQSEDSQASARVTVLANAFADEVDEQLQAQYFQVFPQARKYVDAHDFRFYLLKTERVRYIGGFGEIYWFDKEEWTSSVTTLAKQAQGIIQHMHEDHQDALVAICAANLRHQSDDIEMLTCFAEGYHVRVDDKIAFQPFYNCVEPSYDVRKAMVELTVKSREQA